MSLISSRLAFGGEQKRKRKRMSLPARRMNGYVAMLMSDRDEY